MFGRHFGHLHVFCLLVGVFSGSHVEQGRVGGRSVGEMAFLSLLLSLVPQQIIGGEIPLHSLVRTHLFFSAHQVTGLDVVLHAGHHVGHQAVVLEHIGNVILTSSSDTFPQGHLANPIFIFMKIAFLKIFFKFLIEDMTITDILDFEIAKTEPAEMLSFSR